MLRFLQVSFCLCFIAFLVSCNTHSSPSEPADSKGNASVKQAIKTSNAPEPVGPYSQAVRVGNTLYLAGQIAIRPESGEMVTTTIEEEAQQVMRNLQAVLQEAGLDMNHVVKTTIYMTDLNNFGKVNEIYGSYFDEIPPARVTVGVASLPKGASLEISMIAVE